MPAGETLQAALQRLSGTTLDAQGAANAWAGTTGRDLIGALNAKAGTSGLPLNAVVRAITGSGLEAAGALAAYAGLAPVPITATILDQGTNLTDLAAYPTLSVNPTDSTLMLMCVGNSIAGGSAGLPTVSGHSLTWTQVATITNAAGAKRITVFRTTSSAATGIVSINFGAAQENCSWFLAEFPGAASVAQSKTLETVGGSGVGTARSVTLDNTLAAGSATFGMCAINSASQTITEGAGFTQVGVDQVASSPTDTRHIEFSAAGAHPLTWTLSAETASSLKIAVELAAQLA